MAMDNINNILLMAMPWVKTILMAILGLAGTIGFGYFLFVIKRRRNWICFLWEKKADNRLHFLGVDTITEKKFNKNKQVMYWMKNHKVEVFPPPWECCYRWHSKEYTDYIRIREDEFQPLKKNLPELNSEQKASLLNKFKIGFNLYKKMDSRSIEEKFIYAPINKALVMPINYEMMDYDINMMRINAIENRDKLYADKLSFFEKYGSLIAIGIIVVLIIVVLYMSYDYSSNVINQAYAKSGDTANMLNNIMTKIGGTPPAS